MSVEREAEASAESAPNQRHRSRPLAWRIGLSLGIVVLGVLLLVGVVVNRVVSQGFQTVVTTAQEQRLDDAAATIADRFDRPARVLAIVRRLATNLGGEVSLVGADGSVILSSGTAPASDVATYETPVVVDGQTVATLQASLPGSGTDRGFLPLFNLTLVVAGVVGLLAIVAISTVLAGRLTRPLSDVAAAARRLEHGETGARARGGDDRESEELAEAFNAMADRLERSEMLRRRAASDVAHDLATPATVLETQLQAMIDGVIPTDQANLEAARTAASALAGLVGALGDLASAEAAPCPRTRHRSTSRPRGARSRPPSTALPASGACRSSSRPTGVPWRGPIRCTSRGRSRTWSATRSATARRAGP